MTSEWIQNALTTTGVFARRLDDGSLRRLTASLYARFVDSRTEDDGRALWELLRDASSKRAPDGWKQVCEHAPPEPILLFTEEGQWHGYAFVSGEDIRRVLSEAPGFEFYIADDQANTLLCFNHHDFVIGVGRQSDWIDR
jgi:hypothetical protein